MCRKSYTNSFNILRLKVKSALRQQLDASESNHHQLLAEHKRSENETAQLKEALKKLRQHNENKKVETSQMHDDVRELKIQIRRMQ